MGRIQLKSLSTFMLLALVGCHQAPTANEATQSRPGANANTSIETVDLRAAAEPFEALTEGAFSSKPADLDKAIAVAQAAFRNARAALPQPARAQAEADMAAITKARETDDRAEIALASVDIYRRLVESAAPAAIPVQVSLLDYAGFRYDADRLATPARWADALEAVTFAEAQWNMIASRITDIGLHDRVSNAIAELKAAASAKDQKRAAAAAKAELDLVDQLEAYFAKKPA